MDRHYESVVLINATLEDDKIEEVIAKTTEFLNSGGVQNLEVENWGRKRLAYAVKKSKTGYYSLFRFISSPDFVAKLERFFNLNEQIYRSLTILLSKEDLANIEKQKSEKAEEEKAVVEAETVAVAKEAEVEQTEEVSDVEETSEKEDTNENE